MVKVPVPAVAVTVGAPPQPFTTFGVAAITRLAGSVSVKVRPVRAGDPAGHVVVISGAAATSTLAGSVSVKLMPDCAGLPAPLVNVNVSVEVPPTSIVAGAKALFNDACTTVSVWFVTPLVSTPPTVTL